MNVHTRIACRWQCVALILRITDGKIKTNSGAPMLKRREKLVACVAGLKGGPGGEEKTRTGEVPSSFFDFLFHLPFLSSPFLSQELHTEEFKVWVYRSIPVLRYVISFSNILRQMKFNKWHIKISNCQFQIFSLQNFNFETLKNSFHV